LKNALVCDIIIIIYNGEVGRYMKIADICIDIYNEECKRASKDSLDIKDTEILEISLPAELLARLSECDLADKDTLVGAMRTPRQFGICLKRKFYHIPAFYVEEYPIPKYIALYQSQRMFGDGVAGVKYYGEVKKCTPLRRSKIREIPKKSNELYYKFKIKKWIRLDNHVISGEIGFIRLFTSFFLLENVDDISALAISNEYEFRLYKLLKLASNAIKYESDLSKFSLDGFDLVFTSEIIYLCRDNKICERYYRSGIEDTPSKLLFKIKKDIAGLLDEKI
jgi:hypothetical protein